MKADHGVTRLTAEGQYTCRCGETFWDKDATLRHLRAALGQGQQALERVAGSGSTRLPIQQIPAPWASNLSQSLAYAIGRNAAKRVQAINPYPGWTPQAEAWDAGYQSATVRIA